MQQSGLVRIGVLGRFHAESSAACKHALKIPSQKGRALLAYLAMHPHEEFSREELATLLWADRVDKQARHSLRQCLMVIRRKFEDVGSDAAMFEGDLVRLKPEAVAVDALEFAAAAEKGLTSKDVLALYRGEFLAGLTLDIEPFDDWARAERRRFADLAAHAFEVTAVQADAAGEGEPAVAAVSRLVALDPFREDWRRLLLQIYARHLGRERAVKEAEAFTALLREELDVDPDPETLDLIDGLKRAPDTSMSGPEPRDRTPPSETKQDELPIVVRPAAGTPHRQGAEQLPIPANHAVELAPAGVRISKRWLRPSTLAGVFVGVVALCVGGAWLLPQTRSAFSVAADAPRPDATWTSPPLRSGLQPEQANLETRAVTPIVVLPLTAQDGDARHKGIADAVTDDLITTFSHFPVFRVISRHTSSFYVGRGIDIGMIAKELGVRYVVEGSVRGSDEATRINIRLIDATSRTQVWADSFDQDAAHLSAAPEVIARRIARELQVALHVVRSDAAATRQTDALDMHELMSKAIVAQFRGATPQNFMQSTAFLEQALKRDPDFVPAMVSMARILIARASHVDVDEPARYLARAEVLLNRALELRPDHPDANFELGVLHKVRGYPDAALRYLARSIELNPSLPYAYAQYGHCLVRVGRAGEAMDHIRYALRLGPKDPYVGTWYMFAGEAELESGHDQAALDWLLRAKAAMPSTDPRPYAFLAAAYALLGNKVESRQHLVELRRRVPPAQLEIWIQNWALVLDRGLMQRRRLREGFTLALASLS